ncbi:hypothetical protein A2U01_0065943, partial [Trifolium medium]|nr:hypothetical protein [Trifolium medium]
MADLVMSTIVFDQAFEHISKEPEVDVDDYVNLVTRKDLRSLRSKKKPTPEPEKAYLKPYNFIRNSKPNLDILSNQFYCDLLRLSEL